MRMQPGVTVVLAMVWLYANVVGTANLNSSRLTLDQYSPLAPQPQLYQRVGSQLDWKDQSPAENQPFDLLIDPRRSSLTAFSRRSFKTRYHKKDPLYLKTKGNDAEDDFSPLLEDKLDHKDFAEQKIDGRSAKESEASPSFPTELEKSFVADDTFVDQGPGSMEVYKLDLEKDKSHLTSSTPFTHYLQQGNKAKPPKKTNTDWKDKITEFKPTSPTSHKQSNSFDDSSTETSPISDPFSVGGVPELQVGCEGLEAIVPKKKRSVHSREGNRSPREAKLHVTPITLDLDYDFSEEDGDEEMDELIKLKKQEATTKGQWQNRGDMEASQVNHFLHGTAKPSDVLPKRGDLGKQGNSKKPSSNLDKERNEELRRKREIWGFGEDDGVVASDELQTENQRRRQEYERRRKEQEQRRSNYDLEKIREEYERRLLESKRQEEERQRRLRQKLDEEERRRHQETEEARRRQQELDRRESEERRREWMSKNQQTSNLSYPIRTSQNDSGSNRWTNRMDEERRRQEKLNEYVLRNRPINTANVADHVRHEEEERRKMEEERKLLEYVRRNQPMHVTRGSADRRPLEQRRPYSLSRYQGRETRRRNHGPSAPTNIDPRSYADERRRLVESQRIEEERIRERERYEQEQLRKEALRREEEARRMQSRRYEEQRKRQEAARREAERRRLELIEEQARRSQPRRTRPGYEDHRRRQDTSLIPANLFLNESRRGVEHERQRHEQERRRMEAERRRQEDSRAKETREREQRTRAMKEQLRRQEEARLNALPVSARIIVQPAASSVPGLLSRTSFDGDIDFPGANPFRPGAAIPNFPAPPTQRPPVKSPPACVWAVVQCCPHKVNRVVTCFEALGCPGVNWDPNPCRSSVVRDARDEVRKYYAANDENNRSF